MTTLHITVGDRDRLREDTLEFVQAAETTEIGEQDQKAVLQFGSTTISSTASRRSDWS